MHPFFFGETGKQLYGVYDSPRSTASHNDGVLICYPIGQEYMRSHWACRQLVSQLSRAGNHCMRFDYFGTGDSAGQNTEAGMEQWHADIDSALSELKDIAGVNKTSVVGLRFGAAIAASAKKHHINKLVLWDPVVNGMAYVESMRSMQQQLQEKLKQLHPGRPKQTLAGVEELIGFRFSEKLLSEIAAIDMLSMQDFSSQHIHLVVSEQREDYTALKTHLDELGVLASYQQVSPSGEWLALQQIENALIASEAVTAVNKVITG